MLDILESAHSPVYLLVLSPAQSSIEAPPSSSTAIFLFRPIYFAGFRPFHRKSLAHTYQNW